MRMARSTSLSSTLTVISFKNFTTFLKIYFIKLILISLTIKKSFCKKKIFFYALKV